VVVEKKSVAKGGLYRELPIQIFQNRGFLRQIVPRRSVAERFAALPERARNPDRVAGDAEIMPYVG